VASQIRAVLGHACGDEPGSDEFFSKESVTYVGWGGFLWGVDEGKGRGIRGRSSEGDELVEPESGSELDPEVDSESEEVSSEDVSELESEDDEDDGFVDLLRPIT